ncbi:hypothetical protein MMMDOFMJ_1984 [Methylobacterium gnaphalii]|uniref:Uncharacterized protein n=1 Tax=Methylobacterium gnaphalii TaxID=1010610 RepID=A0A512JH29_9HYPH|nr:hypothetical protein MGN01_11220 [Methylobacterium gnaphalii]GJD69058.1 hypothetical protein MMMDOFMJ_1984 [Methylobacterium gnaphalii]GLS50990.1 hypothetical protein GCM10007885_38440 [Methylobacterium gnaphalii]
MPRVRVLRPFANDHHSDIVQPGDEITVSEVRAKALGTKVELIEAKAAPAPANKMAPIAENKAAPSPVKRGPGRPPRAR